MYYKWMERAWREGGLRLTVMLAVNNEALCKAIDRKAQFNCDDMPAIDRQIQAAKDLEAFIDIQYGGPGRGWYRIAYSPQQARQIINEGKLAVVLGIETPSLFGCKVNSECTNEYVLTELKRYRDMGVRHIYPLHNADNGFGGTGVYNDLFAVNTKVINDEWFDVTSDCDPRIDFHLDLLDTLQSPLIMRLLSILTGDDTIPPRPPEGPNCNNRSLTDLGETLARGMMDLHMIIDVDHLSTRTFDEILAIAEERQYPGIIASHTSFVEMGVPHDPADATSDRYEANKTPEQLDRIRALGGNVGVIIHQGDRSRLREYVRPDGSVPVPYRCGSSSEAWAQAYLYAVDQMQGGAVALGTDMNGLAGVPAPRFGAERCHGDVDEAYNPNNRVVYSDGSTPGLTQMRVGDKPFNYNEDGFANIGLLPDFIQDVRNIGVSEADLQPLFNSAEAYIRMWEATGDALPDLPPNHVPIVNPGGPYLALAGTTITLQGSGGDPDGHPLTFSWDLNDNGIFEKSGAMATFDASGPNRDVPIVMRACDSHAEGSEAACTASRTFVHVRTPGRVVAWGKNEAGQLGIPTSSVQSCGPSHCSPLPVAVPALRDVVDVAAGHGFSLALRSDGTVWTWGGSSGSTPVQISGLNEVAAIAAGDGHALALKSNGTVWAWGLNNYGQLGTRDKINRSDPTLVAGIGYEVRAITAGEFFSLALLSNGNIVGWGNNRHYQLGNQCWQSGNPDFPPTECLSPVLILDLGGPNTVGIAAGSYWSEARDKDGAVFVQGGNDYETGEVRRRPQRIGGLTRSVALASGASDHVLSIRNDGTVWAYGTNFWGQSGPDCYDEHAFCYPSGQIPGVMNALAVAAGNGHSLVLTGDGGMLAWGANDYGQLGRGTFSGESGLPIYVNRLSHALGLAAGNGHNLAIVRTSVSVTAQQGAAAGLSLLDDRGQLTLPAGLVSSPTTFAYTYQDAPSTEAAAGLGTLRFAGLSFTLTAQDASGNAVTSFPTPFTLRLNYRDEDWQRAGITDEQYLNLGWWDSTANQWRAALPCDGCLLDTTYNILVVELDHLTEMALLEVRDTTPPTVTASHVPEPNGEGWYNANAQVTLTAIDNINGLGVQSVSYSAAGAQPTTSPVSVNGDTATVTISTEGETTLTYSAQDRANNLSADQTDTIKLDKTAPVTEIALTGTAGGNGWFTSDVTTALSGADSLSGLKRIEYSLDNGASYPIYTNPFVITQEGVTTLLSRSIDNADNIEAPVMTPIKIDKTPPAIMITSPDPFAVLPMGTILDFGASDAASGIQNITATLDNGTTLVPVSDGYSMSQAGVYSINVQAIDQAGLETSTSRSFVVFDPNGGFVTGGGWFDSPLGAYRVDPTLSGKATFGFVAKYLKNATAPTGNTQFQFHVANLAFSSTSYEWLVVNQSGTNAQFKGSGTINGAGYYKFMLWAGDGSPDTIRIKIWEEVNGIESVIYDNSVGQLINGGSIIVHKK